MNRFQVIFFLFFPIVAFSQLSGYVFDINTLAPLPYSTVTTAENSGVLTDSAGRFMVNISYYPQYIKVSHLGYKTKEILIKAPKTLAIGLSVNRTEINEVIISAAEFKKQGLSTPGSISLITDEMIKQEDGLAIGSVINKIPGVYMQSGSFNTNRLIIRGIGSRSPYSSNRIKAYFEDIPLTTGEGVTTIEDIDMEKIGRIEIIRGPASGIYGAGLGGSINFFADNPVFDKFYLKTSFLGGSFSTTKANIQAGFKINNFLLQSGGNFLYSDGYRQNNQYNRKSFYSYGRLNYSNFLIKFFLYHIDLKAYIPSSIDELTYKNNPDFAAANWYEIRGYEDYTKTFAGTTVSSNIGEVNNYTSVYGTFFSQYELRPFNVLEDQSVSMGLRSRFSYQTGFLNMASGGEVYTENYNWKIYETVESVRGELIGENKENRFLYNLFLHTQMNFSEKMSVTAGINLNRLYYKLNKVNNDTSGNSYKKIFLPVISPRVSFNYQFNKPVSVYALVSHGFSAPSLEETLNPEGIINEDIKPERGLNIEMGFKGNMFERKIFFELSAYLMYVKDLLVTKRISEDIFTGINAGKTLHRGLEWGFNYIFFDKGILNGVGVQASGAYSNNKFQHFIDDEEDFSGNNLPGIPDFIFNSGIFRNSNKGLNFSITHQYLGSMYLNDRNSGKVSGYNIFNARTGYKFVLNKYINIEIHFSALNILNKKHSSMILVNATAAAPQLPRYYYPGLPVNYNAGIRFEFIK